VQFLWFLVGLAIGLFPLMVYRARLHSRVQQLTKSIQTDDTGFSLISQLGMAISHHQETQQELEQTIETWKQIVNLAPIGYLQVDEENRLIWCNSSACQILGMQGAQSPPRLLLELVRSYEIDSLIEKARDRNQPCQREWNFYPVSADANNLSQSKLIPIRGLAFPLAKGEVGVFLENRQELLDLTYQRDRWTSDVAHELRTPLTSIRLVAETLQLRVEPPTRQWVDRLLDETIRLSNLVQDLLDLSQLDLNPTQRLKLKSVDLVKVIYAAWDSLEPLSSEKQLRFSYTGTDSIMLKADEARLYRVFLNLFDNGIKYSPMNGTIAVHVTEHQENRPRLQIDVIDSGPGFPTDSLPHVFERFYRVDPSRVRHQPAEKSSETTSSGSGLGLAIVRQIIEAHQGTVRAYNHSDGTGALLQILLP
jgi:two-component system, OmpR family, phosphate regulon sensor histidine kinase PhoR